jgi:hypothetical protein
MTAIFFRGSHLGPRIRSTERVASVHTRTRIETGARIACLTVILLQGAWGSRAIARESAVAGSGRTGTPSDGEPPAPAPGEPPNSPRPKQTAPAQMSGKFPIDYWNPESSVPSNKERDNSPLEFGYFLQDLLENAEQARHNNDFQAVIRFYRALAKAVPDNAKGWSKLCEAYEIVKDRERAIRACRYALERPAVEFQDYARYVHLVLAKKGDLERAELSDLNAVLNHLEKQGSQEIQVNQLRCEVGIKQKDIALLESCTQILGRLAPDDPRTVVFQWSLAIQKGQRREAERLIDRAIKSGIVLERIEQMRRMTYSSGGVGRRTLAIMFAAGLLLSLLALIVVAIKRRTLAHRATQ